MSARVWYDGACSFLQEERAETSRTSKREQPKKERLATELARATIASPYHHEGSPHDVCKYIRNTRSEQSVSSTIDTGFFWPFPMLHTVLQDEAVRLQISMLLQKADPVFSLNLWHL